MKINENSKIVGTNVILVPYLQHHVLKYHKWMSSKELQELTASEPLTLEEEYQMQKSWRIDEDKCSFIILDKEIYDVNNNEIDAMIGDTNIFLTDTDNKNLGEIEIMIAEKSARGKKRGWEALLLMFQYAIQELKLSSFQAKISENNEKSISLFHKFKFEEISRSDVFKEITFQINVDNQWKNWICDNINTYKLCSYM